MGFKPGTAKWNEKRKHDLCAMESTEIFKLLFGGSTISG